MCEEEVGGNYFPETIFWSPMWIQYSESRFFGYVIVLTVEEEKNIDSVKNFVKTFTFARTKRNKFTKG